MSEEFKTDRERNHWHTQPELWEKLKPLARRKRLEPTAAESKLWQFLRNRQIVDAKFRRQHSIERFIVDFFCAEASLVIEVDGPIHQYSTVEDAIRQEFLESQGFRVIRFTNEEVLTSFNTVLDQIKSTLQVAHQFPLSASGEGGRG
jgi:very-short-patch-repair endonuclease